MDVVTVFAPTVVSKVIKPAAVSITAVALLEVEAPFSSTITSEIAPVVVSTVLV